MPKRSWYDSELDLDFDAVGSHFFAWAGDESHTVMHYIALSNGFGKFDQDNLYRWETTGYLNWANQIAGGILASRRKDEVWDQAEAADVAAPLRLAGGTRVRHHFCCARFLHE